MGIFNQYFGIQFGEKVAVDGETTLQAYFLETASAAEQKRSSPPIARGEGEEPDETEQSEEACASSSSSDGSLKRGRDSESDTEDGDDSYKKPCV